MSLLVVSCGMRCVCVSLSLCVSVFEGECVCYHGVGGPGCVVYSSSQPRLEGGGHIGLSRLVLTWRVPFSLSLSILAIHLYDNLPGDSSSLQLSPANYIVQTHLSNLAALRSATVDLTLFGPGSLPLKHFLLLSISTWCIWTRPISSIVFTPLGIPFAMNLPLPLRFASVYRSSAQGCVHALVAMLEVAFQSTRPPRCPSCLSFPSFRCQKVPLQHSSSGVR